MPRSRWERSGALFVVALLAAALLVVRSPMPAAHAAGCGVTTLEDAIVQAEVISEARVDMQWEDGSDHGLVLDVERSWTGSSSNGHLFLQVPPSELLPEGLGPNDTFILAYDLDGEREVGDRCDVVQGKTEELAAELTATFGEPSDSRSSARPSDSGGSETPGPGDPPPPALSSPCRAV